MKITKLITVPAPVTHLDTVTSVVEFLGQLFPLLILSRFLELLIKPTLQASVLFYSFVVKPGGGSVLKLCSFLQLNLYAFNGAANWSAQRGLKTIFL